MAFAPGDTVVERHLMFGVPLWGRPMTTVADTEDLLAAYLQIGTPHYGPLFKDRETALDEVATGDVQWGVREWVDHNVLVLVRPGDAYSVQGFWNAEGRFVCWYINLQDPMRRTDIGFDSRDHTLDLIVGEDLASWMWKDEAELDGAVKMGLYSADEAVAIRAAGEEVVQLVKDGETWWGGWRDWAPDESWPVPALPEGWNEIAG